MQEERPKAIFYGNGLNQVAGGLNWNDLIKGLNDKDTTEGIIQCRFSEFTSNILRYEAMYLSDYIKPYRDDMPSQLTTEFEKKKHIVETIKEISPKSSPNIYKRLAGLPFSEYITTNYDHSFENALLEDGYKVVKEESGSKETTYSIYRKVTLRNASNVVKRIWHIHGDIDRPRSIQLGYDHYCKSLSEICAYVSSNYIPKETDKTDKDTKEGKIKALIDTPSSIKSWIDMFFAFDIHFIGYALSYDEIDIWWILNKRQRLIKEKKLSVLKNNIYFHECNGNKSDEKKYCLLKTFGVLNRNNPSETDYESFYCTTLDEIEKSENK